MSELSFCTAEPDISSITPKALSSTDFSTIGVREKSSVGIQSVADTAVPGVVSIPRPKDARRQISFILLLFVRR